MPQPPQNIIQDFFTVYSGAEILLIKPRIWKLTHLSRIDFPFLISLKSPFPILGLLGIIFHFF